VRLPSRYFGRATGHHRKRARVHGAIVDQRIVHCPTCKKTTAATVHGGLVRCTEGHQIGGQP